MKENIQWGLKRAKENGLVIIEPKPNEIQIDIDGMAELTFYQQQIRVLRANLKTAQTWTEDIKASKTPGRFHITLTTHKPIDHVLRVALQAILGSDIRRECFNLCRVLNGNKYPIVFFEKDGTP